jgi:deoxyribodipyrimidine photo-lyase
MTELVWFKRDLRVHDHAPLTEAALCAAQTSAGVICLYILEPELWACPEMSCRQFNVLTESLLELDAALRRLGLGLTLRVGDAVEVLDRLHHETPITRILAHEETGLFWTYQRDKAVRRWARRAQVRFQEWPQTGVIRGLADRSGWARGWEAMMRAPRVQAPDRLTGPVPPPLALPTAAEIGLAEDPCRGRQKGGRADALHQLNSFLNVRGRDYRRAMSSPHEGAAACSRLSVSVAFGSLSVREAYQAGLKAQARWQAEGDPRFAQSIASFLSRLHWHCHFMQKLEAEPELEWRDMHPAYIGLRGERSDPVRLNAWIEGQTGFPFVDACMRSLAQTGWLNFRMRAMVMAFSSYHLWQPWQQPAQRLAARFTDFEPGIHFSQAQMQSGTTGINTARIYNPVKQSLNQDPDGSFIRRFVPELAGLPAELLHQPWLAGADWLASRDVILGQTYPVRMVDHETAARAAREQVYRVRTETDFAPRANAIQRQHGSRRSGLPATGSATRRRKARPNANRTSAASTSHPSSLTLPLEF